MKKVLFLCIHNSARSQMAAAFLQRLGGNKFHVESAGLTAGTLNPFAVQVMKEDGYDISQNQTSDAFEFQKQGRTYDYVITVCDAASAEQCPVFHGKHEKIAWSFDDPSSFVGTPEEKLAMTKRVRDEIKQAVMEFVNQQNA